MTLRGAKRGSAGVPLSECGAENAQMDPKSTPYSSQIAPKCISNASKNAQEAQGMPRRRAGAFQRHSKWAPEHPKASQKVPQRVKNRVLEAPKPDLDVIFSYCCLYCKLHCFFTKFLRFFIDLSSLNPWFLSPWPVFRKLFEK